MDEAARETAILEYIEAQLARLRMQADAIDAPLLAYMIEQAMAEARNQQAASELQDRRNQA